jgi:hypothetical protein
MRRVEGSYYTLDEIAEFDEQNLWSWENVWFSTYGVDGGCQG